MSTSSVLVDWSMSLNLEQLMFEQDNSDTKDSKSCLHHAMWAQESSKWTEAHWVIECGSLSIILDINLTMDLSLHRHLTTCAVSCHVRTWTITQLCLKINAGSYLKIQIAYANLLLVFIRSLFFDSRTLNLLELQYNFAVVGLGCWYQALRLVFMT